MRGGGRGAGGQGSEYWGGGQEWGGNFSLAVN